jgi:hypothetical protein
MKSNTCEDEARFTVQVGHRMTIITALMLTFFIVFILSSVLIRHPFVRMNIENGPPIHRA